MRLGDGRCGETGGGKESGEGREFTWIKNGGREEGREMPEGEEEGEERKVLGAKRQGKNVRRMKGIGGE